MILLNTFTMTTRKTVVDAARINKPRKCKIDTDRKKVSKTEETKVSNSKKRKLETIRKDKEKLSKTYHDKTIQAISTYSELSFIFNESSFEEKKQYINIVLDNSYDRITPRKNHRHPYDVIRKMLPVIPSTHLKKQIDNLWRDCISTFASKAPELSNNGWIYLSRFTADLVKDHENEEWAKNIIGILTNT